MKENLDGNVVSDLEKALYNSDSIKVKESLCNFMITRISSFDGAAEGFYRGMMLGLVAGMSSRYYVRSNRESGDESYI